MSKALIHCSLFLGSLSWLLFIYLQSAFAVAIVNIQIPLILGDVVNVVSQFTAENAGNFLEDMRKPATKIIGYYAIQVTISGMQISQFRF